MRKQLEQHRHAVTERADLELLLQKCRGEGILAEFELRPADMITEKRQE